MHTPSRPLQPTQSTNPMQAGTAKPGSISLSMHDGVEVWCDCCSCEAEPYWVEAFDKPSKGADN